MAGQIDVIVAKKAIKELDTVINKLSLVNKELIGLAKTTAAFTNSLSSVNKIVDLEERLKKLEKAQKGSNKALSEAEKLEKARIAAIEKSKVVMSEANKELQKTRKATNEANREIRANTTAYGKLNLQYTKAKNNLANLLSAEKKNNKEIKKAQKEFDRLSSKIKKVDAATRNYTKNVGNYSSAFKGAIGFTRQMVSALGLMGGAFLAVQVIRNVVKTIKDFNKETAVLASVLQKSRKEIAPLIKNAKDLGAITAKTANEVVKLQVAYARLGFSQSEIIDLTEATIEGSIAMNAELDSTAELVGAVVNSMDALKTTDAPKIIDILSLSTAKSALNFTKLSTGLPIVLGAANALNVPLTKVVATLGKLADGGIETSTAATSLRNIFIESAKKGIDYEAALDKITQSQNKLTTANEIFGKRAAVSALVIANNTSNVKELDEALQGAAGTAKDMAEVQLDTLTGEITLAGSAWDGFVLSIEDGEGSIATASRGIISSITGIFNALTNLNELTEIISADELSGGGGNILGIPFFSFIKNSAKASAQLQFLNEDFKELKKDGVDELKFAYTFYEEKLAEALKTDKNYAKLLELQLTRIEDLVIAKRKQIVEDEKNEDLLFEQKQSLIDVLLELDKNLDVKELEKKTLVELNVLLGKYNDEQAKVTKVIQGSIGFINQMIAANNKLILQGTDRTTIKKLQEENRLLEIQKQLLLQGQRASVSVISTTQQGSNASLGDTTLNDATLQQNLVDNNGFEDALEGVVSFVDTYKDQLQQAEDITNAFFDNRIERIQQDIDKNNEFFANQIALAEGNEAEQVRLEKERQIRDAELQKKKRKEQERQAIFNKAIAVTETIINTATAVTKALPNIPLAVATGVLGAAQLATIIAQPIPKFKDGTDDAPSGLAIVGDGGKHEYIEDSKGNIVKTPNTDTLVNLGKGGQKIHKDLESLQMDKRYDLEAINNAAVMSSIYNDGLKLSALEIANVFSDTLDKYQGQIQKEIKQGLKGFKSNVNVNVNTEHLGYMNDTL